MVRYRVVLVICFRGTDGDLSTDIAECTETTNEASPWWTVDLQDLYYVEAVTITNRGDCCGE